LEKKFGRYRDKLFSDAFTSQTVSYIAHILSDVSRYWRTWVT